MRIIPDRATTTVPASAESFTGAVWRTDYIASADSERLAGLRFVYAPGARSFWHVHEHEQAIIAVLGSGLVAWEGLEAPRLLRPGDWWHVEPGVPHWHGATPEGMFTHLAVTAGGRTTWLHEVSEEDYRTAPADPATT